MKYLKMVKTKSYFSERPLLWYTVVFITDFTHVIAIHKHVNICKQRLFHFQFFLAVANYGVNGQKECNSTIYIWNRMKKRFKVYQSIPTWTARDFEYFSINGEHFLAVANHAKGIRYIFIRYWKYYNFNLTH